MKQDDLQIVHAIRGGDSAAFTVLVEKYKKAVYSVILPKVRDFHQAQDLTSETFVTAYLSIESLDAPEKVGVWLCGIARNLANKWLYREKRDDLSLEGLLENTWESAHKASAATHQFSRKKRLTKPPNTQSCVNCSGVALFRYLTSLLRS